MKSINIASILENVYEFGRNEMFFSEDNWARANLTVESVCASAMRIYKGPSDGLYRICVHVAKDTFLHLEAYSSTPSMMLLKKFHMHQYFIE